MRLTGRQLIVSEAIAILAGTNDVAIKACVDSCLYIKKTEFLNMIDYVELYDDELADTYKNVCESDPQLFVALIATAVKEKAEAVENNGRVWTLLKEKE